MQFNIQAAKRDAKGKGASRRLRRVGTTPGIIYGGDKAPVQISLDHNDLFHILRKEAFHSSLISIDVEGSKETVLLRDVQWHPFRQLVLHIDFQRVDANQVTHVKLPLHFVNAELAPGMKTSGGVFSHLINEVDVKGLPGDMPAFIEVDVKALEIGASLHLRDVQLPKGLELAHSTDADKVIASIVSIRGGAAAAAEGEGEGEAQPAA